MLSPVKPVHAQAAGDVEEGQRLDGWRREQTTPSLAEVFGSIRTRPTGPMWRKLLAFLGPGYLVAVGYMDPGNWATSLAGGSKFGYALLFIALLSNIMAIILQALCARLGVASGRDLAQACRDAFPRWVSYPLWALAELAICATDLGRGDRHGDRPQSSVRHSARDRRHPHRARRVPHPVDAEARLPLDRGLHRHPARGHRRLLRHSDRHGRSRSGATSSAASRRRSRS